MSTIRDRTLGHDNALGDSTDAEPAEPSDHNIEELEPRTRDTTNFWAYLFLSCRGRISRRSYWIERSKRNCAASTRNTP
jgi:hypothetical protein